MPHGRVPGSEKPDVCRHLLIANELVLNLISLIMKGIATLCAL